LNYAISGSGDGGLLPGLFQITGPSKHFKSKFALMFAAAFLKKYKDGILLFYDSEFGMPREYFQSLDIDMNRVIHTPITNIEELKHDIMNQLEGIDKGDKIMIMIDSIGNLASKKEVADALSGNE